MLAAYAQCNNVVNGICPRGTACFRFNADYAECRPTCPPTWACETEVAVLGQHCGGTISADLLSKRKQILIEFSLCFRIRLRWHYSLCRWPWLLCSQ